MLDVSRLINHLASRDKTRRHYTDEVLDFREHSIGCVMGGVAFNVVLWPARVYFMHQTLIYTVVYSTEATDVCLAPKKCYHTMQTSERLMVRSLKLDLTR